MYNKLPSLQPYRAVAASHTDEHFKHIRDANLTRVFACVLMNPGVTCQLYVEMLTPNNDLKIILIECINRLNNLNIVSTIKLLVITLDHHPGFPPVKVLNLVATATRDGAGNLV